MNTAEKLFDEIEELNELIYQKGLELTEAELKYIDASDIYDLNYAKTSLAIREDTTLGKVTEDKVRCLTVTTPTITVFQDEVNQAKFEVSKIKADMGLLERKKDLRMVMLKLQIPR